MKEESKVLYSAVVLDEQSHQLILNKFSRYIPEYWNKYAHHMTIKFGSGVENEEDLGKTVTLRVTEIGISEMAIAAKVSGYPSNNKIPHVTLAVNPDGGKPVMSNDIKYWKPIKEFDISGVVTNIAK